MYESQALEYKRRVPELIKSLLLSAVIVAIVLLLISLLLLGVTSEPINQESLMSMIKVGFMFFGPPALIVPFIDFFSPDESNWYMGAGIYYGGAILSRIIGMPWGFLIAIFIACKFRKYLDSDPPPLV